MAEKECIFCDIIAGKVPCFKIYEDERTLAFADINPATPGHCLVVPKTHAENLMEVTPGDLAGVHQTTQKMARAVKNSLKCEGVTVLQLNGQAAGQIIMHMHVHVIPRNTGDALSSLNWEITPGNMEEIAKIAEKIRSAV